MVELTIHPAAGRPRLALALCFGLGLVGSAAWQFLPEPLVTLPMLALLLASLAPFFVPTRYELGEELRITRLGRRQTYSWDRFRAFRVERNGVLLSPYRTKRTGLRSLFLLGAATEPVLSFLRERGLHERPH